jgi:hypothetical protein
MSPASDDRRGPLRPLDFLILVALSGGERHGYGIRRDIADLTDGAVVVDAGILYRSIRRLLPRPRRPEGCGGSLSSGACEGFSVRVVVSRSRLPEAMYRRLLVLYPRRFRELFAEELEELFADRLKEARREGRAAEARAFAAALGTSSEVRFSRGSRSGGRLRDATPGGAEREK